MAIISPVEQNKFRKVGIIRLKI